MIKLNYELFSEHKELLHAIYFSSPLMSFKTAWNLIFKDMMSRPIEGKADKLLCMLLKSWLFTKTR